MSPRDSGVTHSQDGTQIGYTRMGSGPALVICHGALTDQRDWYLAAEQLAADFTVYVFDRRGRNTSGDCADHYSWESEIADLNSIMCVAGEGASLVGHSFGASLSLAWTLHTSFAGKLVLYEPPTSHRDQASNGELQHLRKLIAENRLEEGYDLLAIEMLNVSRRDIEIFHGSEMYYKQVSMVPLFAREIECIDQFKPTFRSGILCEALPLRSLSASPAQC